ncbi:MAG: CoA ester lyase [Pseudomonadales bacterium]|nr:CoA ester lyase [Pseudomonadales bacterium]
MDRLRRSAHFVPGANEKMLSKALASNADGLVLDLEDAVTPKRKDETREIVAGWLRDVSFGSQERIVRMNPLDTPWGNEDLRVTMRHPPDAYVVPKVSNLSELERIDEIVTRCENEHGHPQGDVGLILVSTETPAGVLNLPTFTDCRRVIALSWGAEDLSSALGAPRNRLPDGTYLDIYRHCHTHTLLCAAAGGVQPLDTVFTDIRDLQGLREECLRSAWSGYTGKITIHPSQIDIVNEAFSPSTEEIETCTRLLEAFEIARAQGRMAFSFEGRMVDVPHLTRAQKLIARHHQIEAQLSHRNVEGAEH